MSDVDRHTVSVNDADWTCYPCRPGEEGPLASAWAQRGHRVVIVPGAYRIIVWVEDDRSVEVDQ